ncbi:MAG: undecaprenyldiphospho-muramoylpentapeptide beta-N-acetylglucosaminyltransferase [Actinobacteria bacterium]|nr:undecaprenyldiphospho-muramoylpentapeptide beta-N-acetylglucosaminyltransferase [Actinomycetota bacterium]
MSDERRTVLFAGGGTAGHVFPALAVARELERLDPTVEPVFVGTEDRLEGRLVPEAGFRLHHIDVLPVPRRLSLGLLKVPSALRSSVRACVDIATAERALGAITFGGYVSFPLDWASARLQLPLVIHEQNSVPGLANRFASRWADRIAVTFPGSADRFRHPEKVAVTGNPVREEMLALDQDARREEARRHFGLRPDRATLLVFGGSQGARAINQAAVGSYGRWSQPERIQILHAAGQNLHREAAAGWEKARAAGPGPLVRCVDFIDDMAAAYAAADAVVCRAGATSIAELTALGKPAVLVPYPHATADHQLHNGRALEQAGGATVIEDDDLDAARLVAAVEPWLVDEASGGAVAAASRAFGRRDAATNVATLILDLLPPHRRSTS